MEQPDTPEAGQPTTPPPPPPSAAGAAHVPAPGRLRRWTTATIRFVSLLYLLAIVALCLILWLLADRWWAATVIMYGPRWPWALPLVVLVPAAAILRRRSLWVLAAAGLLLLGPITRLCIPWRTMLASDAASPGALRLRVITCNIDLDDLDAAAFARLVEQERPDVVAFQAWSSRHRKRVFGPTGEGWHMGREDELAVFSRHRIAAVRPCTGPAYPEFSGGAGSLAVFELDTPAGPVHVVNLHAATPRHALQAVIAGWWRGADEVGRNTDLRRRQSRVARQEVDRLLGPVIVAGDFNMPTDSTVYGECWSGLTNAFSAAGWGWGHTHFTNRTSIRIDHILAGPGWTVRSCRVGPHVGSAHRPVIADLEWRGGGGGVP